MNEQTNKKFIKYCIPCPPFIYSVPHYSQKVNMFSALELAILNCYMNGMRQAEVCAELGIGRGTINSRKASIRRR